MAATRGQAVPRPALEIGISLEADQDWGLVADLIEDAYRMTAPKRLIAVLGSP